MHPKRQDVHCLVNELCRFLCRQQSLCVLKCWSKDVMVGGWVGVYGCNPFGVCVFHLSAEGVEKHLFNLVYN